MEATKKKMAVWRGLIAAGITVFLAGCEADGKYPLSGEECRADDPVQTLDTSDCIPPV